MNAQDKLDLFASVLLSGNVSPERQVAMGRELAEVGIEHRRLQRFADERVSEAQEEAEIAERLRRPSAKIYQFPERPMFAADAVS